MTLLQIRALDRGKEPLKMIQYVIRDLNHRALLFIFRIHPQTLGLRNINLQILELRILH